jgi:DNA-directed RNA polymerase specialized sigma24 family protein
MTTNVARDLQRSRTFVRGGETFRREAPLAPGFDRESADTPVDDGMGLPSEEIVRQVASTCLTPRYFEIFERYCRGETGEETGRALNMTKGHLYVEKHRMVLALRECLRQRGLWPL